MQILSEFLNQLCKFLDETYCINYGGCCFVASIIARLLEKDNINYSVVVYECEYDDFYNIDCAQYHYAIKVNDIIINGYEDEEYSIFNNVSARDLKEHYNECYWNSEYYTKHNTFIKKVITIFYNDCSKDLREK